MTLPEQHQSDREISYRIGWKKGKIHVHDAASGEPGHTQKTPSAHSAVAEMPVKPDPLLGLIWKRAPYPGLKAAVWAAAVLPAAAFAAIVWLVSRLSEG